MSILRDGYTTLHDLKDLCAIYNDFNEDKYKIVVYNKGKHYRLVFTGSSHPGESLYFNLVEVPETEIK